MPHQLLFTEFLNTHFAAPVTALLRAVHVTPTYPQAPITNTFAMELLVFLLLIAYFVVVRVSLSVENPKAVAPETSAMAVGDDEIKVELRPWALTVFRIPLK